MSFFRFMFFGLPRNRFERTTRVEAVLFVLLGIFLLVMTVDACSDIFAFKNMAEQCSKSTKGTVIAVSTARRPKARAGLFRIYETEYVYVADGEELHASSALSASDRLSEGDNVMVNYDPSSPQIHYTRYDEPGWGLVFGRAIGGVLCIVYGVFTFKKLSAGGMSYR